MVEPDIYCKVSGMTMRCISDFYKENGRRPVVLEIGCADGLGTMRYAGFTDLVICIDPMVEGRPDIDSRNEHHLDVDEKKMNDFVRRTVDFNVKLVTGCSLWPTVRTKVCDFLGNKRVDILVIDGCHHPFEAVMGDFDTYFPLVSVGGFIVFDDLYENCILQAYEKAAADHGLVKWDRWSVCRPDILQDVASLKRIS